MCEHWTQTINIWNYCTNWWCIGMCNWSEFASVLQGSDFRNIWIVVGINWFESCRNPLNISIRCCSGWITILSSIGLVKLPFGSGFHLLHQSWCVIDYVQLSFQYHFHFRWTLLIWTLQMLNVHWQIPLQVIQELKYRCLFQYCHAVELEQSMEMMIMAMCLIKIHEQINLIQIE